MTNRDLECLEDALGLDAVAWWWLAAAPGLRRGEICGLSRGDVGAAESTLHVLHGFDTFRNLKETKTSADRHDLPLTEEAAAAFEAHRKARRARGCLHELRHSYLTQLARAGQAALPEASYPM